MRAKPNYYVGGNPFELSVPPQWFLDELRVFDSALVIFPSHKDPVYRLMRRVSRGPGIKPAVDAKIGIAPHPDTVFAANHLLVPVTTIMSGGTWSRWILERLAARDLWRHGGAKKVADDLDRQDIETRETRDRQLDDRLNHVSRHAWETFKYRGGERLSLVSRPDVPKPRAGVTQLRESQLKTPYTDSPASSRIILASG